MYQSYVWGRERQPLPRNNQWRKKFLCLKGMAAPFLSDTWGCWAAVLVSICNQITTSSNTCLTCSLSQQRDFPFFPPLLSLTVSQCLGNMPVSSHQLIRLFAKKEPPRQLSGWWKDFSFYFTLAEWWSGLKRNCIPSHDSVLYNHICVCILMR